MNQSRAENIAASLNAVLTGYEAEVVPGPSGIGEWDGSGYCVTVYEKDPQLAILCIFDDGEVLYEPQQATRVITEWGAEERDWLVRVITAEVYAEKEAADVKPVSQG